MAYTNGKVISNLRSIEGKTLSKVFINLWKIDRSVKRRNYHALTVRLILSDFFMMSFSFFSILKHIHVCTS